MSRKAKIDKHGYVHFLNDGDGFSSKDYLLILSTGVFFIFLSIGLVMSLLNKELNESYLKLLEVTVPIVMTVVGGTMGVQAVESFTSNKNNNQSQTKSDESECDI